MEKFQNMHTGAVEICKILQENGYRAFIVGGCVRDLILNLTPKDWDICTNAKPETVMSLFPNNYPTGLQHGTITVAMGKGIENHFEITTFRVEGKYLDGRRPEEVIFVNNIEEDLARRDLTINAMAYDPITNNLIDPFNGQRDLKNGIIKAVGNAEDRFREDGLRIMRAARFAARFGYKIDSNTLDGMAASVDTLGLVSKERISDELSKILMTENPRLGLQLLLECRALEIACPILTSNSYYMHFLNSIPSYSGELETRLAFIYSMLGQDVVKKELIDLKFSNKQIKKVIFLLDLEDAFGPYLDLNESKQKMAYIQFMAKIKNEAADAWEHTYNQFITLMGCLYYDIPSTFVAHQDVVVLNRKEMNINGDDLITMGIKSGPQIKTILDNCYQEILKNPDSNTKDILINFVSSFIS